MKYLVLAHDDMYFCPNWDEVFENELTKIPTNMIFFIRHNGSTIWVLHKPQLRPDNK